MSLHLRATVRPSFPLTESVKLTGPEFTVHHPSLSNFPLCFLFNFCVTVRFCFFQVGRAPTNQLVLDSKAFPAMISRRHAVIRLVSNPNEAGRREEVWEITDLGSVNGIFVNDVKTARHVLRDGDSVVFGGGGKTLQGQQKPQPLSEFIYVFEGKQNPRQPHKHQLDTSF